jgi:hypothetical protein
LFAVDAIPVLTGWMHDDGFSPSGGRYTRLNGVDTGFRLMVLRRAGGVCPPFRWRTFSTSSLSGHAGSRAPAGRQFTPQRGVCDTPRRGAFRMMISASPRARGSFPRVPHARTRRTEIRMVRVRGDGLQPGGYCSPFPRVPGDVRSHPELHLSCGVMGTTSRKRGPAAMHAEDHQ